MNGDMIGTPMQDGWGDIFQTSALDQGARSIIATGVPPSRQWPPVLDKLLQPPAPTPIAPTIIVNMAVELMTDGAFIEHDYFSALFYVGINDSPDAVLPDHELILWADTILLWLSQGYNVLIHCAAGVSRSSYMDLAVQMRGRKMSFDQALAFLRQYRPQANPNQGFTDQLRRLEGELVK